MFKKILSSLLLVSLASASHADDSDAVLKYLNEVMPNTEWTSAEELKAFPGYFHLGFSGRDADTQYYFDADKKVLVVGMMVNLNVSESEARSQSIAPGVSK
jgi:hypothetical protein